MRYHTLGKKPRRRDKMNWKRWMVIFFQLVALAILLWWMYDSTVIALDYEERKYENIGREYAK